LVGVAAACGDDSTTSDTTTSDTTASAESTVAVDETTTTPEETVETTSAEASTTTEAAPADRGTLTIGLAESVLPGDPLAPIGDAIALQFDAWNEAGGVNGYQLELVTTDAGLAPDTAAAAARKLVEQDQVVALLAPQNPADCFANGGYYESAGVAVIGLNTEACAAGATSFPIAPEVGAPFPVIARAAADQPGARVAAISVDVPQGRTELERLAGVLSDAGAELAMTEFVPFLGYDATGLMVRVKQADADVVYLSVPPADFPVFLAAAGQQGIGPSDGVTWVAGVGGYSEAVAAAVGADGEGLIGVSVVDDSSDGADEARALWEEAYPDAVFGQEARAGFSTAGVLRAGLEAVEGDIDASSLLAALASLDEVPAPFLPGTLDFTVTPRSPRLGVFQAVLASGTWTVDDELLPPIG
jgi:branched-chain amino acid transport system substrate-binding protein